jgi:hypothetical protein
MNFRCIEIQNMQELCQKFVTEEFFLRILGYDSTYDMMLSQEINSKVTSPNRAGVAEHHLKIWNTNLGGNLGQKFGTNRRTDGHTDRTVYRVAVQLKMIQHRRIINSISIIIQIKKPVQHKCW